VDNEVTFTLITLVQILFWSDLENIITHLEANWLYLFSDILAWRLDVAESFIGFAIQFWETSGPFLTDFLENIWWYGELGATSIDNCGVA